MEAAKQIETFKEFFETIYEKEVLDMLAGDAGFLAVHFEKLATYSPDLADDLLEDPENVLRTAQIAIEHVVSKDLQ